MAYYIEKKAIREVDYLPEEIKLEKAEGTLILDSFKPSDYDQLFNIFQEVVEEGQTYPQESVDRDGFEKYYLSHNVYVAREPTDGKVVGAFYIKPNFPGRSSHICNAGFLVHHSYRNKGIGKILMTQYLKIAKDLGYKGSFFNLVYASNHGSVKLCEKLGFIKTGVVPKAGNLKGLGYVDAFQFYYDLSS